MHARRRLYRLAVIVVLLALSACQNGVSATEPSRSFAPAGGISAYVAAISATGRFSGALLVSRAGGQVVAAHGMADRATGVANTTDTIFRLGSVSKQFTAMAILILTQRHLLTVNDRVCRYVPSCPPAWAEITLEELLTHSSGIPDYLNEMGLPWPPRQVSPVQLIAQFRDAPLPFTPGTQMRYSNSGYALLGYDIEQVAGVSYATFLQREIFGPLHMGHSGLDTDEVRPGHATGYYSNGATPGPYPIDAFYSAGGLYSTVGDMQRWDDGLDHATLVPAAAVRQMLAQHVRCPPPTSPGGCLEASDSGYGYGWFVAPQPLGTLDYHLGRIDGYLAYNALYLPSHLHVIVLSNDEATDVLGVAQRLGSLGQ